MTPSRVLRPHWCGSLSWPPVQRVRNTFRVPCRIGQVSINHRRSPNAPRRSLLLSPRIVFPKALSKFPIVPRSLTLIKPLFTRCHQVQPLVFQQWFFLSFPLIRNIKIVECRVLWTLVFKACAHLSLLMIFGAMGAPLTYSVCHPTGTWLLTSAVGVFEADVSTNRRGDVTSGRILPGCGRSFPLPFPSFLFPLPSERSPPTLVIRFDSICRCLFNGRLHFQVAPVSSGFRSPKI